MWFYEEIVSCVINNKSTDTKIELEAARIRNANLLQRCEKLEMEKNELNEKLNANQVEILTKKNDLNNLLETLKVQKKETMDIGQRLEISNMHLQMLQAQVDQMNNLNKDSLSELKPIREKLSFKWDVEDCLQKMLVGTRLETAEQDVIIADFKQRQEELKSEIARLKSIKPDSISKWQEEFLDARLREADVILEFDKIKRTIGYIKHDVEERKMTFQQKGPEDYLIINIKDKYQESLKNQIDASIVKSVELQDEVDWLKMEIKRFQKIKEDNTRQMYFNEETKIHLHEVRTSIYQRLQRTTLNLEDQIDRNKKFLENMNRELSRIHENIDRKSDEIKKLTEKIKDLQFSNEKMSASREEFLNNSNQNIVQNLQDEITRLYERIDILQKTSIDDQIIHEEKTSMI